MKFALYLRGYTGIGRGWMMHPAEWNEGVSGGGMVSRSYNKALFCFLGVLLFFCTGVFAAEQSVQPGYMRLYLYKTGTGTESGGTNDFHVSFGDTISIEAFVTNTRSESITALSIYFTIDENYFDIVPQGKYSTNSIKPFVKGNYFVSAGNPDPYEPVGNWTHGDTLTAQDNAIDNLQMDYVIATSVGTSGGTRPVSTLRAGTACTFKLVAKAPCDSLTISMDTDHYNARISSYLITGSNDSYSFRSFQTCYISVSGIVINPLISDIRMLSGTSNTSLDLDDHVGLSSVPDSALIWSVSGGTNITASIDSSTHVVTFTAPSTFRGSETFIFTVGNGAGVSTSDTMQVIVDSPPSLIASAISDTLRIQEDSLKAVLYLPGIVTDPDDSVSALTWFFTASGGKVTATVANDSLRLKGTLNFNGNETLRIAVYDAFGLGDSLSVPVKVSPVNDPPVFSALSAVSIERTSSYTLNVASYVTDVDGDALTLTWAAPSHLVVTKNGMVLTISGVPGYIGSERLRLTVTDPGGLSDTDSLLVTLTKATNPPVWSTIPKTGLAQNHSDSSLVIWNYVTDPDDVDSLLTFTFSNLNAVNNAVVNSRNGKLILSDTNNRTGWDRVTVTATDPDGNSASAQFLAFICSSDSTPLVAGIPDTVIVAGDQMTWIDLDNYYYDIGSSDSEMHWSWSRLGTSADSSATASINTATHVVTLRGIDDEATGINRFIFTVTDTDGKAGQDTCVVTAVLLTSPTVYLPVKVGFTAGGSYDLDLDDYVTDPSYSVSDLTWSWSGNTKASIALATPGGSSTRPVTFSGASTWTGWEQVVFAVQNPLGGVAQDTVIVFSAASGGAPVAGGLATIYLKAGSGVYVSLDNYVHDANTADNLLKWSVSGGDSVKTSITASTRVAYISAPSDTWEGQNSLTFTVTDADNASTTMAVTVIVTDAVVRNVFSVNIFRNPMQEDYIDLYIASDSTLAATPAVKVYASNDSTAVTLKLVSTNYYHGSYVLPLALSAGQKDSARVSVRGQTSGGKSTSEAKAFAYGKVDSSGAKLVLSRAVLDIPEGALSAEEMVTLIPVGISSGTGSGSVELSDSRVSVGPRGLSPKRAMRMAFTLNGDSSGAGVFRMESGVPVFAGADVSNGLVSAEINGGGVYVLGFDRIPPAVSLAGVDGNTARIVLSDRGSGLDMTALRVVCAGVTLPFETESDSVISVDISGIDAEAGVRLEVSAADRLGNETLEKIALAASDLPLRLAVEGNTPNPFNPSTRITFTLTRESDVRVEVYDVTGRRIAMLANRGFAGGRHSIIWAARDDSGREVSSGAYFCRVSAGSCVEVRKMLFLR